MLFDENQHIFKRCNTAIAHNGSKKAGHHKQKNRPRRSKPCHILTTYLRILSYIVGLMLYHSPPEPAQLLKIEETNPFVPLVEYCLTHCFTYDIDGTWRRTFNFDY